MNLVRSILFAVLFYGLTAVLAFLYLPTLALPSRAAQPFYDFWVAASCWLIRYILGIGYVLEGPTAGSEAALPTRPVIFACKHQSAWETLVSHEFLNRPAFVLKTELTKIPFFGWYLAKSKQVSVDRSAGSRALKGMVDEARKRLSEGRAIMIYPQGTRVAPGDMKPYHPGVAALYKNLNLPVVPIALNSGSFWGRNRFMKRAGTVTVRILPTIEPGLDRRAFMQVLEQRIEDAVEDIQEGVESRS